MEFKKFTDDVDKKLDTISVPKLPGKEEYDNMMNMITSFKNNLQKVFNFFTFVLIGAMVC